MCTVNVDPGAQRELAAVMTLCARRLAELHGVDPATVIMGPVDFGTPLDLVEQENPGSV